MGTEGLSSGCITKCVALLISSSAYSSKFKVQDYTNLLIFCLLYVAGTGMILGVHSPCLAFGKHSLVLSIPDFVTASHNFH